jgi:hypothetical protein
MCIWDVDSEIHIWILTLLILGLGFGLLLTSITAVCQAMADTNDVSFATALYTFSRSLGMCIGVAIGGAAFQNKMTTALTDRKLPAAIAKEATVFVYKVKAMQIGPKKELFLEAYADGFQGVFIVFTAIAGIAWLAGLLVQKVDLNKPLTSNHTALRRRMILKFSRSLRVCCFLFTD